MSLSQNRRNNGMASILEKTGADPFSVVLKVLPIQASLWGKAGLHEGPNIQFGLNRYHTWNENV